MLRALTLALLLAGLLATNAAASQIIVETNLDDNNDLTCSLRDAVKSANQNVQWSTCDPGEAGDDDVIVLQSGTTYTLASNGRNDDTAQTGDLDILNGGPLTIAGGGPSTVIDANGIDRAIHHITSDQLTIVDLTIREGNPGYTSGDAPAFGGGILDFFGGLILDRVVLEQNTTAAGNAPNFPSGGDAGGAGGALFAHDPLVILDSMFRNNATGDGGPGPAGFPAGEGGSGGAAFIVGGINGVIVEGSVFVDNRTGDGGDTDTAAGGRGGSGSAIAFEDDLLDIRNSLIARNTVGASGTGHPAFDFNGSGAISADGDVHMRYVTVAGNVAPEGEANGLSDRNSQTAFINVGASIVTGTGTVCEPTQSFFVQAGAFTSAGSGCSLPVADLALDEDYVPGAGSPPVDSVTESCPDTDLRGEARPVGSACDAGAIERGPATLEVSSSSLAFPDTLVGAVSPAQTVDVTYTGEGLASLGELELAGEFTASGCAGQVLASGESCTVSAAFAPLAAGARAGSVSLTNPLTPTVGLGGIGTAPPGGGDPGGGGPGPGGGPAAISRAAVSKASLKRKRGKVKLKVVLACRPGTGCAERLDVRVTRKKRKATVARDVALPGGATSTQKFKIKRKLAKRLRKGAKVKLRIRLIKAGQPTVESSLTRRVR